MLIRPINYISLIHTLGVETKYTVKKQKINKIISYPPPLNNRHYNTEIKLRMETKNKRSIMLTHNQSKVG